jgi:hypothetical protein
MTSAVKSCLASMPASLATQGKDSVTLGLTYASRSLSAAETQVVIKEKTTAATETT